MSRLPRPRAQALLADVIGEHLPGEETLVQEVMAGTVTREERDRICQAIIKEFGKSGLAEDDEPTRRGLELEALLDEVNRPNLVRPPEGGS